MGQTLTNGIYLPDEGEVRCYAGLASNWTTLDAVVGGYNAHVANENIHITSAERNKWNNGVSQAYVLRYANTSLTALGTVAFSALDNTDNIKIGDKVLDSEGKLFALTAVDTANSTATLSALLIDLSKDSDLSNYYTKGETDTLLNDKANDADAVHKSGAETIAGPKTFNSNTSIYNSDNSAVTPNLYLRSSKIEIAAQGNTSGDQYLAYADKNNTVYVYVRGAIQSNGSAVKIRASCKDNSDNSIINEIQILANTNGRKIIFPSNTNETELGTSSYKWKDVNTVLINGLTPSILSLPVADRSLRIDISGYFTNTTSGGTNEYTVVDNGYIMITVSAAIQVVAGLYTSPGKLLIYNQSYTGTTAGAVRVLIPVVKGYIFILQSYSSAAIGFSNAYFIPCQGNV